MNIIRITVNDNFSVYYDKDRGMYKVVTFEDGNYKNEIWFDAYEEKQLNSIVRKEIANAVEEKMTYMCGCLNCIEKIKMIISDKVKPYDNLCKDCKIECHARTI